MDKAALRERVWDDLEDSGAARFPFPPHGRIPNFAGADAAADRLADTAEWEAATVLKANPDAPQLPARRQALRDDMTVFMAVPRLRDERPFYRLDPTELADVEAAPTVSNVEDYAEKVSPTAVDPLEFVLVGSVAVTVDGARVGKGEGYSDLEFAVLNEAGLVGAETTVATTVHERQVVGVDDSVDAHDAPVDTHEVPVDAADVPVDEHDVPLDLVVTPDRVIRTDTPYDRPTGIDWAALSEERIEEIPLLARLRDGE